VPFLKFSCVKDGGNKGSSSDESWRSQISLIPLGGHHDCGVALLRRCLKRNFEKSQAGEE
jgi:hypothetical protein